MACQGPWEGPTAWSCWAWAWHIAALGQVQACSWQSRPVVVDVHDDGGKGGGLGVLGDPFIVQVPCLHLHHGGMH